MDRHPYVFYILALDRAILVGRERDALVMRFTENIETKC